MYVPALFLYLAVMRALIALRAQPRVAVLRGPTAYYLKKRTSVSGFACVNDTVLRVADWRFQISSRQFLYVSVSRRLLEGSAMT